MAKRKVIQPDAVLALRERLGLTQQELADALNTALGRNYNTDTIRRWERGDRGVSAPVQAFLEQLEVAGDVDAVIDATTGERTPPAGGPDDPLAAPTGDADSAPAGIGAPHSQSPLTSATGVYAVACRELWEMVAMGCGTVGALTGSPALEADAQIILADAEALGQAWGRLAETNETFRKMLAGATEGGVWLQVSLVTGTTLSKCWQAHGYYAAEQRRLAESNGHFEQPADGVDELAVA